VRTLTDIWPFCPTDLRPHGTAILMANEGARIAAVEALAASGHPDVPRFLKGRLPDISFAVNDRILRALVGLDPTLAVEGAKVLCGDARMEISLLGSAFRLELGGRKEAAGRTRECAEALRSTDRLDRLLASLDRPGPGAPERARKILKILCQQPAVSSILERLPLLAAGSARQVLEEVASKAEAQAIEAAAGLLGGGREDLTEMAAGFLAGKGAEGTCRIAEAALAPGLDPSKAERLIAAAGGRGLADWVIEKASGWLAEFPGEGRVLVVGFLERAIGLALRDLEESRGGIRDRIDAALRILGQATRQGEAAVRVRALAALAAFDGPGWRKDARTLLRSRHTDARLGALDLLGKLGEKEFFPDVVPLIGAPAENERELAMKVAESLAPDRDAVLGAIRSLLGSSKILERMGGAIWLGRRGGPKEFPLACRALEDKALPVVLAALDAACALAPSKERLLAQLRRAIHRDPKQVRQKAIALLGEHGTDEDWPVIEERARKDDEVAEVSIGVLVARDPPRALTLARALLGQSTGSLLDNVWDLLRKRISGDELAELAMDSLSAARYPHGADLLGKIAADMPGSIREALAVVVRSKSTPAKEKGIELVLQCDPEAAPDFLKGLLQCRERDMLHLHSRQKAFEKLLEIVPGEKEDICLDHLDDGNAWIVWKSVESLSASKDPAILERLIPLTRSMHPGTRMKALEAVARLDDPRVLGEILSSANDVDVNVRGIARNILKAVGGAVPVLGRIDSTGSRGKFIDAVRDKVSGTLHWISRVGHEILGRPVAVRNYRQGLGRTPDLGKRGPVEIEVSDFPIASGHPHGEDIVRGLGLHEIGHHICDIGVPGERSHRGKAVAEGVGEIYDILRDERLERVLRSRRPEYGIYFDRLASYAFAQNIHEVPVEEVAAVLGKGVKEIRAAVTGGALPGRRVAPRGPREVERLALGDVELLRIPGLFPVRAAFLACLRCGMDPRIHPDPRVAEAVALVPADLKDLPHPDVLETARKIAKVLGKDDRFRREMKACWNRLSRRRALRGILRSILDRLGEAGSLPGWMWGPGVGIRNGIVIIHGRKRTPPRKSRAGPGIATLNLGKEIEFPRLAREQVLAPDPRGHVALVAPIRRHVRRLRGYLERLGRRTVEEPLSRRGRRIDIGAAPRAIVTRSPGMLVFARDEILADAYIGILIDRSGSMNGPKLVTAKTFAALIAESACGVRGIEGHISAFDDSTFYRLGDLRRNGIARVEAGGGNNDAGGLARAAELALRSRKRNRLIVMVSDGLPTECTVGALTGLVRKLSREKKIVLAQVAVDPIQQVCFPHFVDLTAAPLDAAVARFGNLIVKLTRSWR
jgi:HEAT repeat protein